MNRKKFIYMGHTTLISNLTNSINNSGKSPALIPFIVSGFPDFAATKALIKLFEEKGAAAVELGVPFSDPLADGSVIQKASKDAINSGVCLEKIFQMLLEIKADTQIPIILFTYYNPVLFYGCEKFVNSAKNAGVAGLIIPDLPLEEAEELSNLCKEAGIDLIMLVAPTSGMGRIEKIAKASTGFVYMVSSTGVTGVRETFSSQLGKIMPVIRNATDIPVAVGFGISKKAHLEEVKALGAEGAIIGSAIVRIIEEFKADKTLLISKMGEYLDNLY